MQKNNANANEIAQRAAIVAEARSWIGTPYHNCADVKGAGVDCGMLLVRVFVDTGLCEPFDPRPYPPDWHLHRAEEKYLGFVFDRAHEVSAPQPGDVAVFRFGRCYSHGGIVTRCQASGHREWGPTLMPDARSLISDIWIVHAYAPAGRVLEERVQQNAVLGEPIRAPKFFSLWSLNHQPRADELAGGTSSIARPSVAADCTADFAASSAMPAEALGHRAMQKGRGRLEP